MNLNRAEWDRLYRYCLALCGQPADAEDLLHNALERYLNSRGQDIQCPQAWMRRVARNLFLDQQRRLQRLPFESLEFPDEMQDQGQSLEAGLIDQRRLEAVWHSLNPAEREVIFLWAAEGLSASEIALQLGEPRGTILSRLHRLRSKLSLSQPATPATRVQGDV